MDKNKFSELADALIKYVLDNCPSNYARDQGVFRFRECVNWFHESTIIEDLEKKKEEMKHASLV